MTDNKNTILAIVLSAIVLIVWQFFFAMPQEKARQEQLQAQQQLAAKAEPAKTGRRRPAGTGPQRPRGAAGTRSGRAAFGRHAHHPRRGAGRLAAHPDHDRERARLDRPQGRPPRRSGAGQVPRNRRPEIAADRAAVAVRQSRAVLCRIRLDQRRRRQCGRAKRRHALEAIGLGRARHRSSGDADLRQRPGPRIPPHHRGRRQVSVHDQGRGGQQVRQAGHAVSVRADFASRHAADARAIIFCTKA